MYGFITEITQISLFSTEPSEKKEGELQIIFQVSISIPNTFQTQGHFKGLPVFF